MVAEHENIPQWFADFTVENERQHSSLAQRIARLEAQMKILIAIAVVNATAVTGAAIRYIAG